MSDQAETASERGDDEIVSWFTRNNVEAIESQRDYAKAKLVTAVEALEGEQRVAQAYRNGLGAIATFSVPGVSGGPNNSAGTLAEYAQKVLEAAPLQRRSP